ncbi:acyltransferase family protein [Clostridium sp.]|uniref:acyltransferase family protein n=1 Tax=Clostridium sp. TaxID=1506 RepID=UPI00283DF105|nr:acyltransferase family protein [Clostridium sp.]MDR3598274.1 acyltransferase family protein [Clostridium sp.]
MSQINSREDYMDIVKALGIILVVMAHVQSPGEQMIFLFHMPLFFFVSGYFYKDKYSDNIEILIKKRLKLLYIPFIKYELIFLVLHNFFVNLSFYSSYGNETIKFYSTNDLIINVIKILTFNGTEVLLIPLWFLPVLFFTTIIFCLINRYFKLKWARFLTIVILFILGIGLKYCDVNLIFNYFCPETISISLVALAFFYIGYLYNRYKKAIKLNFFVALVLFAVLVISRKYNIRVDMRLNSYSNPIMLIPDALCGIYLLIYISRKMCDLNVDISLLKYIGRNTIPILALQYISFKLIYLIQIIVYKLPIIRLGDLGPINSTGFWWIIFTMIGVLLPIIIHYISNLLSLFIVKWCNIIKVNQFIE